MKNILIFPQGFPSKERPGSTYYIYEHALALQNRGFSVHVLYVRLVSGKKPMQLSPGIHHYTYKGIDVYETSVLNIKGAERITTYLYCSALKKLYKHYSRNHGAPDLIETHFSQYAGYAASRLTFDESIPFIAIEHAGWYLKKIPNYQRIKLEAVIRRANKLVCVSYPLKNSISQQIGCDLIPKIIVLPNMIENTFRYTPVSRTDRGEIRFFSAGNLYVGKRFDLLIRSFCQAFREEDAATLRIAGEGNKRKSLEQLIVSNHREKQIRLLGMLNREEMLKEYQDCDCFVLPSEHESFGIVYREAMAVGRPIITTKHQGFEKDWNDKYGIRVDIDDEQGLVRALQYMSKNIDRFNGKEISDLCIAEYSEDKVMEAYIESYGLGRHGF